MGATHVTVTVAVSNPADPNRRWEGLFLVDTGAIDCYVPGSRLREIGIVPGGKRSYELGDGTELVLDIAVAQVEFMGELVGATVIFGSDLWQRRRGAAARSDLAGISGNRGRPEKSATQAVTGGAAEVVEPGKRIGGEDSAIHLLPTRDRGEPLNSHGCNGLRHIRMPPDIDMLGGTKSDDVSGALRLMMALWSRLCLAVNASAINQTVTPPQLRRGLRAARCTEPASRPVDRHAGHNPALARAKLHRESRPARNPGQTGEQRADKSR